MQALFRKNIALLLFVNLLVKPLYIIGIDAQVQNAVGASEYGLYFALFNFCFLFQIVLDLGIQNYNSRYVAAHPESVSVHLPHVLSTKLLLIIGFAGMVGLGGLLMGYPPPYFLLLGLIVVFMASQSLYLYLRSHFSALGFYTIDSWLSALDKFLMIIIVGYMLYVSQAISIVHFIMGQILALVTAVIIVLFLLSGKVRVSLGFSWIRTRSLLAKSWPFALVVLLMTLYTKMDGVMLEALLDDGAYSAGVYAAGYRLLDAANMVGYLFAMLLLPMFATILSRGDDVGNLVRQAFGMLLVFSTIITLLSWFYAPEIIGVIYTNETETYIEVFRWLMVSFWFMSLSYVFGSLITASGRLRWFNTIFLAGIIINWILNYLWIPAHQAPGAAWATLITQAFVFGGQVILARNMFKLHFPLSYLVRVVLLSIIYLALIYLVYFHIGIPWMAGMVLSGILCLTISFFAGFFRLSLDQTQL